VYRFLPALASNFFSFSSLAQLHCPISWIRLESNHWEKVALRIQKRISISFKACEMAALKPFAVYGLTVPAGDIAIEADGNVPYPATVSKTVILVSGLIILITF